MSQALKSDHCCCYLVAKSHPTFCDPVNCSLPDSCVHGISQARILEWVAVSSSRGSSPPRDQTESPESANSLPMSHHGNKLNHSSSKDFGFQTFKTQHWVKKKGSC